MPFRDLFTFEYRKIFIKRNIVIFIGFVILTFFFCQDGISDYKLILANKKPFQEVEKDKVSLYIHYTFFGINGVRAIYIPKPISIIFSDLSAYEGMTARVDTADRLDIDNSLKGKDLLADSGGFMDFSGIILLIGSFIGLLYGFDGTRKQEYLTMIGDMSGSKKISIGISISRMILLTLAFWILSFLAFLWIIINGIDIGINYFLIYNLVLAVVIILFVGSGAVVGLIKNKSNQFIILPIIYFLLVFFIPWVIQRCFYIEAKNAIQSIHEFEYDKFKYIMDFEKRFFSRFGVWKSGKIAPDEIKKIIQSGQDIEYKKIREAELKRIDSILKRIRLYHTISMFLPSTFYISTNREISSKGYLNFINFYRYAYKMKQDFIKFYIDRKFYKPLPAGGVEPFIKEDENILYGRSQLPYNFILGLGVMFLYIAIILFIINQMGAKIDKDLNVDKPGINFNESNSLHILCENKQIKEEIFAYYQQDNQSICIDRYKIDQLDDHIKAAVFFKYLCRLSGADQAKAGNYLSMINGDLNGKLCADLIQKMYFCVKCSREADIYVINNIFKYRSKEFEKDFLPLLTHLSNEGAKILYLDLEYFSGNNDIYKNLKVDYLMQTAISWGDVSFR